MDQELIWNYYHCCVRTKRNVGSCGLHVAHAAFCIGCQATYWKIEGLLRTLWYLFHNSPARWDDYTTVTGSTVFPMKFCTTQWVTDDRVAERALEIWLNVEKYIKHVLKEPKSKNPQVHPIKQYKRPPKMYWYQLSYKFLCTFPKF